MRYTFSSSDYFLPTQTQVLIRNLRDIAKDFEMLFEIQKSDGH